MPAAWFCAARLTGPMGSGGGGGGAGTGSGKGAGTGGGAVGAAGGGAWHATSTAAARIDRQACFMVGGGVDAYRTT